MIRPRIVIGVLLVSVIVWWFAPNSTEVVAANVPPVKPASTETSDTRQKPLAAIPLLDAKTEPFDTAMKMLFGEREPLAQLPTAPPIAALPALPDTFQLLGKALIDGAWKAIIAVDGKSYLAGTGDKVADRYVVEKLAPPALIIVDLNQSGARFDLSVGSAP